VAAGRRDWAEAVWAEAREVPPGWPRLVWRAGGVWLIAREALTVYRPGRALLFAVTAFPFIGLAMSPLGGLVWGSAAAAGRSGPRPGGGGPPGPEPAPDPPGGRRADADDADDADEDRLTARSPSLLDQVPGSEDRREPRALQPV